MLVCLSWGYKSKCRQEFSLLANAERFSFWLPTASPSSHSSTRLAYQTTQTLTHLHISSSSSSSSSSLRMNLEEKVTMDLVPPSEHLCYVRCNFCNTVLAVGIPCKRLLDTVTVKCGHCSNLSFLSTRPPLQGQCLDHQLTLQGFFSDVRKCQSSSSSSSTSSEPLSPKAPFVVKPPEKKHRLPSAYNRFMKEEIQRIKAANPEIPHREAFSTAAKNWARYIPNSAAGSVSGISNSD
ncbi:protein CRABS CLAW isoform X3 [Manihot esculenta]|uniref:protein CRABS CLAW isoform X3 n=1 Tax=Manihot esculenta TaxID=3983 RepID=UPI001CC4DAEB|nr:protein CRABS CLAW isoform X3 [Manihot esculenta]